MAPRTLRFLLLGSLVLDPSWASAAGGPAAGANEDEGEGEVRRIKVEPRRLRNGVILFPTWDHPRVRAFMLDEDFLGPSMLDAEPVIERVPLLRPAVGVGTTRPQTDAQDRRRARRYARQLVRSSRDALTRCYETAREREAIPHTQVVFGFALEPNQRGLVRVDRGHLVDRAGDRCARSVLDRASVDAALPEHAVRVSVPVWFWMHTVQGP